MKKLFQNTAFIIGFWSMILIFLTANIIPYDTNPTAAKFNVFITDRGFPFLMFSETLSSAYTTNFYWFGLAANFIIALVCSFLVGWIFKFVWSKIISNRLN